MLPQGIAPLVRDVFAQRRLVVLFIVSRVVIVGGGRVAITRTKARVVEPHCRARWHAKAIRGTGDCDAQGAVILHVVFMRTSGAKGEAFCLSELVNHGVLMVIVLDGALVRSFVRALARGRAP